MSAFAYPRDLAGGAVGIGNEPVDQRGFSYAGVSDECGDVAVNNIVHVRDRVVSAAGDHGDVEVGELCGEGIGAGQVCFGEADNGVESADERRNQGAFHESRARWRVGDGGDDEELVGVGNHDALVGVGVVGGAS